MIKMNAYCRLRQLARFPLLGPSRNVSCLCAFQFDQAVSFMHKMLHTISIIFSCHMLVLWPLCEKRRLHTVAWNRRIQDMRSSCIKERVSILLSSWFCWWSWCIGPGTGDQRPQTWDQLAGSGLLHQDQISKLGSPIHHQSSTIFSAYVNYFYFDTRNLIIGLNFMLAILTREYVWSILWR